jgi:hypothetical protein
MLLVLDFFLVNRWLLLVPAGWFRVTVASFALLLVVSSVGPGLLRQGLRIETHHVVATFLLMKLLMIPVIE